MERCALRCSVGWAAASGVWAAAGALPGFERLDQLADPVDDAEDPVNKGQVRRALARANFGQRILGRVAESGEARKVEKAAIALHSVNEAEDLVEPLAVAGRGFPGNDLTPQRLEHVARLGNEVVDQFVHDPLPPVAREGLMGRRW
jgi:hypothetical protein